MIPHLPVVVSTVAFLLWDKNAGNFPDSFGGQTISRDRKSSQIRETETRGSCPFMTVQLVNSDKVWKAEVQQEARKKNHYSERQPQKIKAVFTLTLKVAFFLH